MVKVSCLVVALCGSRVVWAVHDDSRCLEIEVRGCSSVQCSVGLQCMKIEGYEDHSVRELRGVGVAVCGGCGMGRFWCGGF